MSELKREWLIAAKGHLGNAKRELVYVAKALRNSGGNFETRIKEIKENIGDIELAIESLEEFTTNKVRE